jgi:cell pole-organizing protein PopZ
MEEILASIRRIIADDDALPLARRPGPALVSREVPPNAPPAANAERPPVNLVTFPSAFNSESAAAPPAGTDDDLPEPEAQAPEDAEASPFPMQSEGQGAGDQPALHDFRSHPSFGDELPPGAGQTEPYRSPAPPAPEPSPPRRETHGREAAPLVSPTTDASVASSFQTLATSMFLHDSDLLARTTREMLRPMLKQWLDDNLPVIVERLVRAEIERVARGGR